MAGSVELNADNQGLVWKGAGSTLQLRTDGNSVRIQTAGPLEEEKVVAQEFQQAVNKLFLKIPLARVPA